MTVIARTPAEQDEEATELDKAGVIERVPLTGPAAGLRRIDQSRERDLGGAAR